ncbi:hypothetical protein FALCPG4_010194 [Fusarium falciforme]
MHKAFTLTQKRRARDKMVKRYNKLVDAVENVWPRNTGSIATLVRRTLARAGIIGSLASRFVVPARTKYQKRARRPAKRMQGFEKELLRKFNDPTDAMDMEHAIQELHGPRVCADVSSGDVAANNKVDFDYARRFEERFAPTYCSLGKLTLEPSAGHAAEQDAMLSNVHVEEHGDDEWALPPSYVSVDDENDLSIHATESSADEDDPLAVEEEAANAMDTGKSVARRSKGVSVVRLKNTPAPALETTTSLSMAVVFFAPPEARVRQCQVRDLQSSLPVVD